jgi:hypothetical protein
LFFQFCLSFQNLLIMSFNLASNVFVFIEPSLLNKEWLVCRVFHEMFLVISWHIVWGRFNTLSYLVSFIDAVLNNFRLIFEITEGFF